MLEGKSQNEISIVKNFIKLTATKGNNLKINTISSVTVSILTICVIYVLSLYIVTSLIWTISHQLMVDNNFGWMNYKKKNDKRNHF